MPTPTRERDEEVLSWVRLRAMGFTTTEIGKKFGVSAGSVTVATDAVRKADEKHVGANARGVKGKYW